MSEVVPTGPAEGGARRAQLRRLSQDQATALLVEHNLAIADEEENPIEDSIEAAGAEVDTEGEGEGFVPDPEPEVETEAEVGAEGEAGAEAEADTEDGGEGEAPADPEPESEVEVSKSHGWILVACLTPK